MKSRYSFLLVGPSSVTFTDAGEDATITALTAAELSRQYPEVEWDVRPGRIFPRENMRERLQSLIEEQRPDVVTFRPSAYQLTHDYVLWSVRQKYPRLYGAAKFADARIKWLAGGARDHADTPRPWVYAAPRWLARRLFGATTNLTLDECIATVTETLDYLLLLEDVFVYLWPSSSTYRPSTTSYDRPEHTQNRDEFWQAVMEYARRRHVPTFTSAEMREQYRIEKVKAADGIHGATSYRSVQARFLAERVLAALDLPPPLPAGERREAAAST